MQPSSTKSISWLYNTHVIPVYSASSDIFFENIENIHKAENPDNHKTLAFY